MYDILVSPEEMSKRCGISAHTIRNLCRTGYGGFPSTKVGNRYRMNPDLVMAWVKRRMDRNLPIWETER